MALVPEPVKHCRVDVIAFDAESSRSIKSFRIVTTRPVRGLHETWARLYRIPQSVLGFEDMNECLLDLNLSPKELGWEDRVSLYAVPLDKLWAEVPFGSAAQSESENLVPERLVKKRKSCAVEGLVQTASSGSREAHIVDLASQSYRISSNKIAHERIVDVDSAVDLEFRSQGSREPRFCPTDLDTIVQTGVQSEPWTGVRTRSQIRVATGECANSRAPTSRSCPAGVASVSIEHGVLPLTGKGLEVSRAPLQAVNAFVEHESIVFKQDNPKKPFTAAYLRYEKYKAARTPQEAVLLGARRADLPYDFNRGFMRRA
jgi:hypothetical protein